MKTSLKSSALPTMSAFHMPTPPSTFGQGFQQFLASAPAYADEEFGAPVAQPLRYLESVPPADQWTFDSTVAPRPDLLSESLGAAILIAARPTTKSLALAKAVHALRHG